MAHAGWARQAKAVRDRALLGVKAAAPAALDAEDDDAKPAAGDGRRARRSPAAITASEAQNVLGALRAVLPDLKTA